MKKRITISVLVVVLLLATAIPAAAIVWGQPDGDDHPMVGLVVFDVGGVPSHRCSGTLLSPTVLLTAGHCAFGTDAARVWFESEITDPFYPFSGGTSISGTPFAHPDYDDFATFPNTSDVGVVILDEPVLGVTYASLAEVGALDSLATQRGRQNQLFTIVGYGVQSIVPNLMVDLVRYQGNPMLVNLRSAYTDGFNLHLSSNPGKRSPGGACFGDSGGPAFIGDSTVVSGVGSFVLNLNCVGAGFYYRVDTAHAQDFILNFLD